MFFALITVQELNTLHTDCDLERNLLLTILAMSVQNPQLARIFLTGNRSNFLYVEDSITWLTIVHIFSLLYTKLIDILIVYLYISKILL